MARSLTRRRFLGATAAAGGLLALRPGWAAPETPTLRTFPVKLARQPDHEALRALIDPAADSFDSEREAVSVHKALDQLRETGALPLAPDFEGRSPMPLRYEPAAEDTEIAFFDPADPDFAGGLKRWLESAGEGAAIRFYPLDEGRIRYEIRSRRAGRLEYRVGHWRAQWSEGRLTRFEPLDESLVHAERELFAELRPAAFETEQLAAGTTYWRSRIDSASGIDVYGQNGVAVGDIDNDGRDEIYVCQPGGLPNLLFTRGAQGQFEEISAVAGVDVLDASSSALFVDFRNVGLQDLVVLTASRPLYFLNQGDGTFRHLPKAFRFARAPQGAFTGMSAADYDGDGRVDLYLCSYIYFQSEDQYSYPAPYHDARNGPPNFLFRNELGDDGSGRFEDVTIPSGINENNDRYSFAAAWCDYDADGRAELYVANDFGRNNLYKYDGERFRDIAEQTGVEDLGPGMSATWLDYDSDGRPDLFVTNMWTPAGKRTTRDEAFSLVADDRLSDEYRRHTKGNSLYRNRGDGTFAEVGAAEGVEMGRWSWAGDALDFDCDGTPELYVAAGMLTGSPSDERQDLMSFFWRQVVAHSGPDAKPSSGYEKGWNALNQFIREGYGWNGGEPNVFYRRRGERFFDFSGISGLDLAADTRSFAATDLNGDGRLDLLVKNRLGPQLAAFQNLSAGDNHALVLSLRGVQSNRDAIGAWVVAEHEQGKTAQLLKAGSGYLCQHTKRLHLGLGQSGRVEKVTIRWPSGAVETIENLEAEQLYEIVEGSGVVAQRPLKAEPLAAGVEALARNNAPTFEPTWLLEPVPLPEQRSGPGLLCLVAGESVNTPADAAVEVVDLSAEAPQVAAWYALFGRYLFDYRSDLKLPMTLLVDERSRAHKIYPGVPDAATMRQDLRRMNEPDRRALALPFPGTYFDAPSRNYFRHGAAFFGAGYPQQALPYLDEVLRRNDKNFKAQLAVGQIHLEAERPAEAKPHLEAALALSADSPAVWNNLGGLDMAAGDARSAAEKFEKAITLDPNASFALVNAGQAWVRIGNEAKAEQRFRGALEVAPNDAEAADRLGLLLAQRGDHAEAKELFQRAIESQRDYASAINNLAVLYLQTNETQEAVAALRYGIRVAPRNETLYMNLARIYVQSGDRERARDVLEQLALEAPGSETAKKALRELGTR